MNTCIGEEVFALLQFLTGTILSYTDHLSTHFYKCVVKTKAILRSVFQNTCLVVGIFWYRYIECTALFPVVAKQHDLSQENSISIEN